MDKGCSVGAACKCCMLTFSVPYNHLDLYNGRSKCRTVPVSGLIPVNTALLRYGPKPYADHALYGHSRIRYGRHPYRVLQSNRLVLLLPVEGHRWPFI